MKTKVPYELLVRFNLAGQVQGAHIKAQSYYTKDDGTPDLDTWREESPTPTELASPELAALVNRCALSLADQLAQVQADLAAVTAERDAAIEAAASPDAAGLDAEGQG